MPTLIPGSLPDIDARLREQRIIWLAAVECGDVPGAKAAMSILDALLAMRARRAPRPAWRRSLAELAEAGITHEEQ